MINRKTIKLKRKKELKMGIVLEFKKKNTPSNFYTDEEILEIAELSMNYSSVEDYDNLWGNKKEK